MNNLNWLNGLGPSNIVLGLDTIKELLSLLDNPQNSFRAIHVAGSDGKGSVCALISSVLNTAGIKTGLYTSPHISKFNERISISGIEITDNELNEYAGKVKKCVEKMNKKCTFFEAATALAFLYFKEKKVEYIVAEVGMGGRLDATNIVVPEVCVINHISVEHKEFLGDTVEKIAYEKAGIIKKGVPVVTNNTGSALEVIKKVASDNKSELFIAPNYEVIGMNEKSITIIIENKDFVIGIPGDYQASNAALAFETLKHVNCKNKIEKHIKKGFEEVKWPCRLQKIENMPIIIDVSHTKDGSEVAFSSIKKLYGNVTTVFGLLNDKDAEGICKNLSEIAKNAIVTLPKSDRAANPKKIAKILSKYMDDVEVIEDFDEALDRAMKIKGDCNILVTGSFYMAEGAIKWLKKTSVGY